jgi:DNA-binding response OmpR family regulator
MHSILLIEDDAISQKFLTEAITLLPVNLMACTGFGEAEHLCRRYPFDLIISDIHASDGQLYEHVQRLTDIAKILAISAEITPETIEYLQRFGIERVLVKPITITTLHQTITQLLACNSTTILYWDKDKALAALDHNEQILTSLKSMFKAELPPMSVHIQFAFEHDEFDALHTMLHKLKASCGLLGASRLLQECTRLDSEVSKQNLDRFMDATKYTLQLI